MAPPDNYKIIQNFIKNNNNNNNKSFYLPLMQRNDRFITSAIITGLINRVIWIQPDWSHPKYVFSDQASFIGTVVPGNGKESGKGNLCFCFYQTRDISLTLDMFCGYFPPQGEVLIDISVDRCKKIKPFSMMTVSETLFCKKFNNKLLKEKHVILDIDEDYFGVQSGVQVLIDAGIPLDVVYVIDEVLPQLFCPDSIMAEQALNKALRAMFGALREFLLSKNKKKSLSTKGIVLKHIGKYICHKHDVNGSSSFQTLISYLDSKLTLKIASALSNTKYCLFNSLQLKVDYSKLSDNKMSDFSLCHGVLFPGDNLNEIFVETRVGGIEKRGKRLSKLLSFISESVTPKIITIARSLRDGYVPRKQQRLIEHTVRKAIETNLSKRFLKSETIFDENLVCGKDGWK